MINLHCDAIIPDGPMKEVSEIEKSITTTYKKTIWSKFLKAVDDFELVKDGDKIAIGVSGGKDSLLLAKLFHELKKDRRRNFEFKAVSLNPGFREEDLNNFMKDLEYHTKQYESPKRSTVAFVDWLETFEVLERSNILDMACGGGG